MGALKNMFSSLGGGSESSQNTKEMMPNSIEEMKKLMGNMPNMNNMTNRFGGMGLPGLGGKPSKRIK